MANLTTGNISLDIKYIFLNFAQKFFSENSKFKWTKNVQTSKIIIADKNSIDLGVVTRRPSIILNRGGFGWTYSIRGQKGIGSNVFSQGHESYIGSNYYGSADKTKNAKFTDLLRGSVSFNVLSKNGVLAEELGNLLFMALSAYADDLKAKGIHQIVSLSFGEEQTLRATSEVEVAAVQVNIGFLAKKDIQRGEKQNNCVVYVNGVEVFEGIQFRVATNGTQIVFDQAPASGTALQITYAEASDLTVVELANLGTGDGNTKIFTIPASGAVYGYYKLLAGMIVEAPTLTSPSLTENVLDGGVETEMPPPSGVWFNI